MTRSLTDEDRKRLLAEVRALAGASLQRLWLPSASACVLQFRVPARTQLVVVDARLPMAALADERPTSPESAPRSQATLRNAIEGSTLVNASLLRPSLPRLDFSNDRSLVADDALLLIETSSRRIVWASAGAQRRPGSIFPEWKEIDPGPPAPLPDRSSLVRDALSAEEASGFAARKKEVVARLRSRVQKLRKTQAAVDEDAARAARADADRALAELLLPIASRIHRGAREAQVEDWSRTDASGKPAIVTIPLDPAVSAPELAARWLRKAKRYQAAARRIAARRAEVAVDLAAAETSLQRAQAAATAAELLPLEPEVTKPAAAGRKPEPRLPYRTFLSHAGARILVGRSAKDNDALTLRVARGNDVWLHVRDRQGAHVVIPGAGDAPDSIVLGDAALLAAHFSSFRGTPGVEVAWTRCKHVRKPRGAPPGSVVVTQEKTLRVRLDPERLAALLETEGG
ncbi:MAG: NFACT RNA binding domain-containing protein [Myxococcales bacterium]|nr:NFACT RNA binding domain-containing protein [Myxococcales bacterium]